MESSLQLSASSQRYVKSLGKSLLPFQREMLERLQAFDNIVASSSAGAGKTTAALIHIFQSLEGPQQKSAGGGSNQSSAPRALVLSPVREVAFQTGKMIEAFQSGLSTVVVCGGTPIAPQRDAMKDASVMVGTPGRVLMFVEDGGLNLSNVEYIVLDELDRMLEMGFEAQLAQLLQQLPGHCQFIAIAPVATEAMRKFTEAAFPNHVVVKSY